MTTRTYKTILRRATEVAANGGSIIIDATFSRQTDRDLFRNGLEKKGIDYVFIESRTPRSTIRARLEQRPLDPNVVSDARLEDLNTLDRLYEPPDEVPKKRFFTVTTSGTSEQTLRKTLKKLIERRLQE